jgi:hypothetical protein
MFTFFAGDRTFFRDGVSVKSYTAVSACSPLFDFSVYLSNGVFVESSSEEVLEASSEDYIPFYDPKYERMAEDTISGDGGKSLFRVLRPFTPPKVVTSWSGIESENTVRKEEYAGNLLRYVSEYACEEPILPQTGKETSSLKLGAAKITLIPRNVGRSANSFPQTTYVWENTDSLGETPELSWFSSTTFQYSPPDYSGGTLSL